MSITFEQDRVGAMHNWITSGSDIGKESDFGVTPGAVYKHYKGQYYWVYGVARHSESEEVMVVYQALYGKFGYWVRPLEMFLEEIVAEGKAVKRFEKVDASAGNFSANRLFVDPDEGLEPSPDMAQLILMQEESRMYGVMLTPGGKGPCPTLLMLHGFPGNERNFDLAHAIRRTGWNVMVFHYRGTWGSEGAFSFENALSDIDVALDFIKSPEVIDRFGVDPGRIVIAGNSYGGFAAILSAIRHKDLMGCIALSTYDLGMLGQCVESDVQKMTEMRTMFEDCVIPTVGAKVEVLVDEVIRHKNDWNLALRADELQGRPVLMIAGSRDLDGPHELHFDPLVQALNEAGVKVEAHLLDSDHGFQNKRVEVACLMGKWMEKLL
jgi:hypothetical protein